MSWINKTLLGLLIVSIALNLYLLTTKSSQKPMQQTTELGSKSTLLQQNEALRRIPSVDTGTHGSESYHKNSMDYSIEPDPIEIEQIKHWINTGNWDAARVQIQSYLREYPQDTTYLLLEAQLIEQTYPVADSIAHYYTLLDYPLSDTQRTDITTRIMALANDNIGKLKAIQAWDILATFLEPLWQFGPTEKQYILPLAETYARQGRESLMENVLASLPQWDEEAIRIRRMLVTQGKPAESETPADIAASSAPIAYERTLSLARKGDHFYANLMIGRDKFSLMLDTGASTTVLAADAFARIRHRVKTEFIGNYRFNTAGGLVEADVYRVPQLFFAGFDLDDVAIAVIANASFGGSDGLLGMNILRQFDFKIDQNDGLLMLNLNPN